jgi:hypothetical protein
MRSCCASSFRAPLARLAAIFGCKHADKMKRPPRQRNLNRRQPLFSALQNWRGERFRDIMDDKLPQKTLQKRHKGGMTTPCEIENGPDAMC